VLLRVAIARCLRVAVVRSRVRAAHLARALLRVVRACTLVDSRVSRAVVCVISRAAVLLRERRRVSFAGVARHFCAIINCSRL
jgi:hypothetical protein